MPIRPYNNRWVILSAAVGMQMCLGAMYSWNIHVEPLKRLTDLSQSQVQWPFTCFYLIFPFTVIFSGKFLARLGPTRSAMIGGGLFGLGWLVASLGSHHYLATILGLGLLGGIGVGMAYVCPISICIAWFPKNKGLITGLAVAGFGGGAMLVTKVASILMTGAGWTPYEVFRLLGVCYLALTLPAGSFMRYPASIQVRGGGLLPARQVIGPAFVVLYVAFFCALSAGFAVNANLKQMFAGGASGLAATAIICFAFSNAAGRVVWGLFLDLASPRVAILLNLALQGAMMFAQPVLCQGAPGFLAFALLVGFAYGGALSLYASTTSHIYGSHRVGQVYGWLFSANMPAALAPVFAGWLFEMKGDFVLPLRLIGGILIASVILVFANRRLLETRVAEE